jgi:uncharacterized repeat protein (TIGR02543 family)
MSNIEISENEIINHPDRAIYILANAYYSNTWATIEGISIVGNTISGDAEAITLWSYGAGSNVLKNMNITENKLEITNEAGINAAHIENVSGTSRFCGNFVNMKKVKDNRKDGIYISGAATGSWMIEDNYLLGNDVHAQSIGILFAGVPATASLDMNRNTVTGWDRGILTDAQQSQTRITLRSNCIFENNTGVANYGNFDVDAAHNYWGYESGPYHSTNLGGEGNAVTDKVIFAPWYTDKDCTTTSDGSDPLAMGLMQAMLETVTVTFNGNGGTPAITEVEIEGEATVETLPTVTRDGYTFVEWNTESDGTGEVFTPETVVIADMTVYAIWEETVVGTPTIVSIADVANVEVDYGTVEDDAIAALAATTTIEDSDGVTHTVDLSWTIADYDGNIARDYTATGTFMLPEGVYQADPAMSLEVIATVTVKAEAVVESLTVTFDGNEGTPATTEVEVETGATLETLPTVTRDGYTFVEWNALQDGTGEVFTTETVVTADMTVYAIWEEAEKQHETGTDVEVINDTQEDEEDVAGGEEAA